jgi:hypothetical protein
MEHRYRRAERELGAVGVELRLLEDAQRLHRPNPLDLEPKQMVHELEQVVAGKRRLGERAFAAVQRMRARLARSGR